MRTSPTPMPCGTRRSCFGRRKRRESAGCNQDFSELLRKQLKAPLAGYKNIRAYLSAGSKDTIAPPSSSAAVKKSLTSNGIHDSRLMIHDGGPCMLQPHFDEALKWFTADRQKDKSATSLRRPSDNSVGAAVSD